jgi:peptide chain release factor 1
MSVTLRQELEEKLQRFEELERQMADPAVLADPARLAPILREHGTLAKVATRYRRLKQLNAQIAEAEAWLEGDDPELKELAESELPNLRAEREACWEELLELTSGGQDAFRNRCVLEIRAGTGGEEAALFARDLFNMYRRYAESRGWKWEVMDVHPSDLGGFKEVIVGVEGEGVFRRLQYESGVHRVQRVPETEAHGRIHTSAATVAVLPEPEDIEIELKPEDYREDVFSASGPGGQHVNKTASAIRLTHLATGIVVTIQDERSQHKNRAKALRVLKARLYELRRREEEQKRAQERRSKIGTGDRSERIRTYNFPENRVTDHRIGLTLYQLDQIMEGHLDPIIDALLDYEKQAHREAMGFGARR